MLALVTLHAAQPKPHFGEPHNGISLGAGFDKTSLIVIVRNTGKTPQEVLIAGRARKENYFFEIHAKPPKGGEIKILDMSGDGVIAGYVEPVIASLQPGESRQVRLPLEKLIFVENRRDVGITQLRRRGCQFNVRLEITPESARWSRRPNAWTGLIQTPWFR